MQKQPHCLVVGAGAIGSFYGALLKRAGCQVSVVVRSDYEVVAQQGFQFESPLGDLSWQPDHVTASNLAVVHAGQVDRSSPTRFDPLVCLLVTLQAPYAGMYPGGVDLDRVFERKRRSEETSGDHRPDTSDGKRPVDP